MLFLEDVKIVSIEEHKIHHKHRLYNIENDEVWYNLYVPKPINNIGTRIFKYIVSLNTSNLPLKWKYIT